MMKDSGEPNSEDERRNVRFSTYDLIAGAYNKGDFDLLLQLLQEHCDENIQVIGPPRIVERNGIMTIFTYFVLCNDTFPDSLLIPMEKRISSFKQANPPPGSSSPINSPLPSELNTETIEFIDKFIGTRVTDKPVIALIERFCEEGTIFDPNFTPTTLDQSLAKLYSDKQINSIENENTYIAIQENALTFDLTTNKIIRWKYTPLAANDS